MGWLMKAWQKFLLALGVGAVVMEISESSADAKTKPLRTGLPQGKGLFIEGLVSQGQNPQHLIERLTWLGIKWVAIEIAWFGPPGPSWTHDADGTTHNLEDNALAAFVPELVAAGIDVWVWGFPSPDRQPKFVQYVKDAYEAAPDVTGVIIDPEKPYYASQHGPALEDLISQLQDLGRPVGVTSYGRTGYHPNFPWEAISGADFGMPQIYSDDIGDDYPAKADESWRQYVDVIIPLNGAYGKEHTPAEMQKQAELTNVSDGGIGWWNYRLLILDTAWDQPGRANMVRNFEV